MADKWRPDNWDDIKDNLISNAELNRDCNIDPWYLIEDTANAMLDSIVKKELDIEVAETKYQELISMIFEELEAFINKEQKDEYLKMKGYLLKKLEEIK